MNKELLRTKVVRGIEEGENGVDWEHGIIRGFAVMTKGNVKDSRGWEINDDTLADIATAGNSLKKGLKSRFGHPNMSSTALGTFLGRAKNFRHDGDLVRADLFIDKTAFETPDGDLATYVMNLAESDPDAFGSSVVLGQFDLKPSLNDDGTKKKDDKGNELPPVLRVKKLFAVDVVDDPAANNGMFGSQFFTDDIQLSDGATRFLDKFLSLPDAVEKVIGFLERYRDNKDEEETINHETKEENTMELTLSSLTLEQLTAGRQDLVASIEKKAVEAALAKENQAIDQKLNEAVQSERTRVLNILSKGDAFAEGIEAASGPMKESALSAIKDGLTEAAAESNFKTVKLDLLKKNSQSALGHAGDPGDLSQPAKPMTSEEHLSAAKEYATAHQCSMTKALKATAPARKN